MAAGQPASLGEAAGGVARSCETHRCSVQRAAPIPVEPKGKHQQIAPGAIRQFQFPEIS
jgi:hypothetical protein